MVFANPLFTAYVLALAGLCGLVMGSFINCWAWRLVHGESIVRGRSHCTSCGHELAVCDLVPVFSWLVSRGKCRYCGERVSERYPISEVVCSLAFIAIVARFGITLEALQMLAFAGILLFLSLTDLDDRIIPNGCIVAAFAVRLLYLFASWAIEGIDIGAALVESLVGALVLGGGVLAVSLAADRVLGRESMGGGDVKLLAAAGFYFGWQQGLLLLIIACLFGLVAGAVRRERVIPFGPSIAAACLVTMFAGAPVITWYASLLL